MKRIRSLLCRLGLHAWRYDPERHPPQPGDIRTCRHCPARETYFWEYFGCRWGGL